LLRPMTFESGQACGADRMFAGVQLPRATLLCT